MENTQSILGALFKYVYSREIISALASSSMLQKAFPMVPESEREGGEYWIPVRTSRAHGWTMNGTTGGAFALNAAEPQRQTYAHFRGSTFMARETIGDKEVHALLSSKGSSRTRAFVDATSHMVEALKDMAERQQELQLLYGGKPVAGLHASAAAVSGTGTASQVKQIADASWVPAMWEGSENGYLDFYDSTGTTHRNPTTECKITAVDLANKRLTLSGDPDELDDVTNSDLVYFRGTKTNGMSGLVAITSNTSGSVLGISASTYSVWASNTHNLSSARLSQGGLLEALQKPINRGAGGKFTCYCSFPSFTDCMNDLQMLKRIVNKNGGTLELGDKAIVFTSRSATLEVVPHIYMWPSLAVIVPDSGIDRRGTTDTTFGVPGKANNLAQFSMLPDNAGYQMRILWDLALFVPKPSNCCYLYGIVNGS